MDGASHCVLFPPTDISSELSLPLHVKARCVCPPPPGRLTFLWSLNPCSTEAMVSGRLDY